MGDKDSFHLHMGRTDWNHIQVRVGGVGEGAIIIPNKF